MVSKNIASEYLISKIERFGSDPVGAARRFVDVWLSKAGRSGVPDHTWQSAMQFYINQQRRKENNKLAKLNENTVISHTKEDHAESALVR